MCICSYRRSCHSRRMRWTSSLSQFDSSSLPAVSIGTLYSRPSTHQLAFEFDMDAFLFQSQSPQESQSKPDMKVACKLRCWKCVCVSEKIWFCLKPTQWTNGRVNVWHSEPNFWIGYRGPTTNTGVEYWFDKSTGVVHPIMYIKEEHHLRRKWRSRGQLDEVGSCDVLLWCSPVMFSCNVIANGACVCSNIPHSRLTTRDSFT